jgi:hypothetical protein
LETQTKNCYQGLWVLLPVSSDVQLLLFEVNLKSLTSFGIICPLTTWLKYCGYCAVHLCNSNSKDYYFANSNRNIFNNILLSWPHAWLNLYTFFNFHFFPNQRHYTISFSKISPCWAELVQVSAPNGIVSKTVGKICNLNLRKKMYKHFHFYLIDAMKSI